MIGSTSILLNAVRDTLRAALADAKWKVLATDNALNAFNALAAPADKGTCVLLWRGEAIQQQAYRSLVARAQFSVYLLARRHLLDNGLKQASQADGDYRLLEIHDRVKGALLALKIPDDASPNPDQNDNLIYEGAAPVQTDKGFPSDILEQRWYCMIDDQFGPDGEEGEDGE